MPQILRIKYFRLSTFCNMFSLVVSIWCQEHAYLMNTYACQTVKYRAILQHVSLNSNTFEVVLWCWRTCACNSHVLPHTECVCTHVRWSTAFAVIASIAIRCNHTLCSPLTKPRRLDVCIEKRSASKQRVLSTCAPSTCCSHHAKVG